jgi:hypothetical protein
VISKSRLTVTIGLVTALGVSAIAYADGVSENTPNVVGKVTPKKLDEKKKKPVNLFLEVSTYNSANQAAIPAQAPEKELLKISKNVAWKSNAAPFCGSPLNGTTTVQAKALCPAGSAIGNGVANVLLPGPGGSVIPVNDEVVTVFNGPSTNQVRLHAYSPTLGAANTQVISGSIIGAGGGPFKKALSVPDAPDIAGDAGAITKFNATIGRKTKVARANCAKRKMKFERTVTYDDGTSEKATFSKRCKRKR